VDVQKQIMTEPKVLVVDDDAILLESIADLLLISDFAVVTASNGAEALGVIEREQPDCIISDVMMPEMDGYGLLEAIRARDAWSSIPVILITAYDRPYSGSARREVMPDAVLSKPFDVDHLIDVIRGHIS
jgi:CheY-like chemotaxis protein